MALSVALLHCREVHNFELLLALKLRQLVEFIIIDTALSNHLTVTIYYYSLLCLALPHVSPKRYRISNRLYPSSVTHGFYEGAFRKMACHRRGKLGKLYLKKHAKSMRYTVELCDMRYL